MATKVTIRRTATRKDGNSKGTVKTSTKTVVTPTKTTTSKSKTSGFRIPANVSLIKSR